tara:strand:+ start:582 stop:734 length:153 start_codon:yes stop_codon:yes gene_type:complete
MNCYKRAFESEGIALTVLGELKTEGNKGIQSVRIYKCDECEMWHFTSMKK